MENKEETRHLYTKGDRDMIVKRCDSVHTITMYCPIQDEGIKLFRTNMFKSLNQYIDGEKLSEVPMMDVFMCFMNTLNYCKLNKIAYDNLYSFWGMVQSFKNLHYMNIEFTDDINVLTSYEFIRTSTDKSKSFEMIKYIYKVDVVEIILNNLFTQNIIDMINKVLMFDNIISNSYLEREFLICFQFEEYVHYMDMLCTNMSSELNRLDPNIIDYLILFPKIISDSKPTIRILTNYNEV